jgi:CrcB protein
VGKYTRNPSDEARSITAALPLMASTNVNGVVGGLVWSQVVAHGASPQVRTTLGVGFLGGFTTFSTFAVQAFLDIEAGELVRALVLVLATVLAGVAAAAAGYYVGRVAL